MKTPFALSFTLARSYKASKLRLLPGSQHLNKTWFLVIIIIRENKWKAEEHKESNRWPWNGEEKQSLLSICWWEKSKFTSQGQQNDGILIKHTPSWNRLSYSSALLPTWLEPSWHIIAAGDRCWKQVAGGMAGGTRQAAKPDSRPGSVPQDHREHHLTSTTLHSLGTGFTQTFQMWKRLKGNCSGLEPWTGCSLAL